MQEQLKCVAGAYPAIPKITADGIYGPATAEAVRVFQKVFGLPQTGEVDYTTWYKISEIYVGAIADCGIELTTIFPTWENANFEFYINECFKNGMEKTDLSFLHMPFVQKVIPISSIPQMNIRCTSLNITSTISAINSTIPANVHTLLSPAAHAFL